MRRLGHRVQLSLLLAAAIAPSAVLVIMSMRVVNQDRELRVSRRAEERKRVLTLAAAKLRAALDSIRADEIRGDLEPGQAYRHPETVFVAWSEQGQLVLPWEPERDRAARQSRELLSDHQFESAIRSCEPGAWGSRGSVAAADCYQRAEKFVRHPLQLAYLRWRRAASLEGATQRRRAVELMQPLLDTSPHLTDPDGIPIQLYASQSLLHAGVCSPRVISALESVLSVRPWHSPLALLILAEASQSAVRGARDPELKRGAEALQRKSAGQVKVLEQAQLLQAEFPRLREGLKTSWAPFGDDLWLVGSAGDLDRTAVVFVVRGHSVFQAAGVPGAVRLADPRDPAGEFMGEPIPGVKLVLAATGPDGDEEGRGVGRTLLFLTLLLTVGVTIFAAYLLWRDLQREMRVSELRAQFVSSVSHELKTPLTAIRMFAETMQMGRCPDPAVQAEYLGTIVNECERLSRLVEGVLLFSRAEQGKKIYRFRPISLAEAVYAAVRAMEYQFSQHGFRLHLTLKDDKRQIWADRDAIEQAILNLLSNAMKFSADARDVDLAVDWSNSEALIRVTDHGIGIAPEEQSRIFEKFYRASTPQNQLIPGAGLGLALVAQIAQAHGGSVTVESALGKGSVFSFRLPAPSETRAGKEQSI